MQALQLQSPGNLELVTTDEPILRPRKALVAIRAAALNKRDQWILEEKYPGIVYPCILGSDGAGTVVEVADEAHKHWEGKEVIINPNINWGNNPRVQGADYNILGMPTAGTFAERIVVDVDRLAIKPGHLGFEKAAALPLAGLTAYRAVFTQGKIDENKRVLISGFGGGVAQFAFQYSIASGAETAVSSGDDNKIAKAKEMGAISGHSYKIQNWTKEARSSGGFDVIIDSAGGEQLNDLIRILKPNGKLVFYGASNGLPAKLDLFTMFWKQLALRGTTMGNDEEFIAMVKFVEEKKIEPLIASENPIQEFAKAFEEQKSRTTVGKVVLTM